MMNERLLKILDGNAEFYPQFLEDRFPRVFNKILELCETKLIEAYLLDLMVDKRGGTRQGFPPEAATEIVRLGRYFSTLEARKNEQDVWNNIPELKRLETQRLGYVFSPQGFLKAVENDNHEAVRIFLSSGVDLEVKDERGWTPLMIATANGKASLAQLLINSGARLIARDINGFTPLHWAALQGMSSIVALLISKGVDVDSQSKFKWTPLMQACTRGHRSVCSLLIAAGANLALANSDGSTALQIASSKGFGEIVQLFLAEGANRNEKDSSGNTPLTLSKD
jgi:ankyrin repeat protein